MTSQKDFDEKAACVAGIEYAESIIKKHKPDEFNRFDFKWGFERGARWMHDQLRAEIEDLKRELFNKQEDWFQREAIYKREIDSLKHSYQLLNERFESECAKSEALGKIMEQHQRTIAVMAHDLISLGVNFDFDKVEERWNALKESGDE